MPSFSRTIYDDQGRAIGIACGRRDRRTCSTPGCTGDATVQCDFPVTRKGKEGTCDRYVCRRCAVSVGKDKDYCPPHARARREEGTMPIRFFPKNKE